MPVSFLSNERIKNFGRYTAVLSHQDLLKPARVQEQTMPALIIYRFMHNMYYANMQVFTEEVLTLARGANPPLSWFCIDLVAVDDLDFTAAETLRTLHGILTELDKP